MSELVIVQEKKNGLMNRVEFVFSYENVGKPTPKNDDVIKLVSDQVKKDVSLVSVKQVSQQFGGGKCVIRAFVYAKKEDREKAEVVKKKQKVKSLELPELC